MSTTIFTEMRRDHGWGIVLTTTLAGLLLGTLTAVAQQYLPDTWRPMANSSGSWTLISFVAASRARRLPTAALLGGITLLTLLAGYGVASEARGHAVGVALVLFWGLASVTVGPVVGVAASFLSGADDRLAALGTGLVSGVLIGEGAYGLTLVADTTKPHWWITSVVIGATLFTGTMIWRRSGVAAWGVAVATTATVATTFWLVYQLNLMSALG